MKVRWISDFIDLFYPQVCCGCTNPLLANENLICIRCLADLPQTDFHHIRNNPIERVFIGRCNFEKATAFLHFVKQGIVQNLLHYLKYKDRPELGKLLGRLAAKELILSDFFTTIDMMIPIPLHPAKEKKRGYNQSEWIGKGLHEITGIPIETENLIRIANSGTQTKRSRFDRWLNVEQIFTVNNLESLENKHILILDDVLTTGSTIEAAVTKLERIPGIKISLLTIAYAR